MRYHLKHPLHLGSARLEWVDLRPALAGDLIFARADIANHGQFGPKMMNDDLTLSLFTAQRCTIQANLPSLPLHWGLRLTADDLTGFINAFEAVGAGYESVEAYMADMEKLKAEAKRKQEAALRGDFPVDVPTGPAEPGETDGATREGDQGGARAGAEPTA